MTRLLLDQGIDANVQKRNFGNPLHLASTHGYLKVAELLVHRGASSVAAAPSRFIQIK
jgi:ankyrin repeat protein